MVELIICGRGGQGVGIAAEVLASALFAEGKYVQLFPSPTSERPGTRTSVFLRYDQEEIWLRCEISNADHIIALDPAVLFAVNFVSNQKPGGILIVNTAISPDRSRLSKSVRLATVDVNRLAYNSKSDTRSPNQVGSAILGAFAKMTGDVKLESLDNIIRQLFANESERCCAAVLEAYRSVEEVPG